MTVSISLAELAECCRGEVVGDPTATVLGVSSLVNPKPDTLGFYTGNSGASREGADNAHFGDETNVLGAILVKPDDQSLFSCNRILVDDPYLAYAQVSMLFCRTDGAANAGIHDAVDIHPSAVIADDVSIGAYTVIGPRTNIGAGCRIGAGVVIEADCEIGSDCTLAPNVTLCRQTRMGARCNLSPGVVIGASGFGYAPTERSWKKIYQHGGVVLGNDVDVGANTTIDCGAIDDTVIGNRVKLDNQIQIAHNVMVGDDTIMAGCVAIAGSTVIGSRCRLGGRASVLGHLKLADGTTLLANAFVAKSIDEPGVYASMIPARPVKAWRKTLAYINRLERLFKY